MTSIFAELLQSFEPILPRHFAVAPVEADRLKGVEPLLGKFSGLEVLPLFCDLVGRSI